MQGRLPLRHGVADGLSLPFIRWCRRLLRSHADCGGTVLLSSHFMGEVASIADELVVIGAGRIRAAGSVACGSLNMPIAKAIACRLDRRTALTNRDLPGPSVARARAGSASLRPGTD